MKDQNQTPVECPSKLTAALYRSTSSEVPVTKSVYWHFLEVLPPLEINARSFKFQEGMGDVLSFSEFAERYTCQADKLTLCDEYFCLWLDVKRNKEGKLYIVDTVFSEDNVPKDSKEKYQQIAKLACSMKMNTGLNLRSVTDIERWLGVHFRR